jgi:hypothetical protein
LEKIVQLGKLKLIDVLVRIVCTLRPLIEFNSKQNSDAYVSTFIIYVYTQVRPTPLVKFKLLTLHNEIQVMRPHYTIRVEFQTRYSHPTPYHNWIQCIILMVFGKSR